MIRSFACGQAIITLDTSDIVAIEKERGVVIGQPDTTPSFVYLKGRAQPFVFPPEDIELVIEAFKESRQ